MVRCAGWSHVDPPLSALTLLETPRNVLGTRSYGSTNANSAEDINYLLHVNVLIVMVVTLYAADLKYVGCF